MILNPPNQEPPTYKETSSKEIITQKLKKLDDIESYISDKGNRTIIQKACFRNQAEYCMKSLRDYFWRIAQLNNEFPHLKADLDKRIRNLINVLDSQYKKDLQINEFAKSFLRGMMIVGDVHSCTTEIIKRLNDFLTN